LRSASALANPLAQARTPEPAMSAILMIVIFIAALVGLNIYEHGRAD
jgi:hypothetical protein